MCRPDTLCVSNTSVIIPALNLKSHLKATHHCRWLSSCLGSFSSGPWACSHWSSQFMRTTTMGGRHSAMINRDGCWLAQTETCSVAVYNVQSPLLFCDAIAKRIRTLIDSNVHDKGFQVYIRCVDMTSLTAVLAARAGRTAVRTEWPQFRCSVRRTVQTWGSSGPDWPERRQPGRS